MFLIELQESADLGFGEFFAMVDTEMQQGAGNWPDVLSSRPNCSIRSSVSAMAISRIRVRVWLQACILCGVRRFEQWESLRI